jgi:hypothetical protein
MPIWEYREIDLSDLPRKANVIDLLNDAGDDGWELVAITINGIGYLKRQLREPARPASRRRQPPSKEAD